MFRIGEIQETTSITQWNYVPTKSNVADLGTKQMPSMDFSKHALWFAGPKFLREKRQTWPNFQRPPERDRDAETRTREKAHLVAVQHLGKACIMEFERFSKWKRMLRTMAYVKRFINALKGKVKDKMEPKQIATDKNLTAEELNWSQACLYRLAQADNFACEIRMLKEEPNNPIPKSSSLRTMSPFLDECNVLRQRGRIHRTTLVDRQTKEPIILPKNHAVTRLVVEQYHRKFNHANHETVINEVFKKFKITGLRTLLRSIRYNCQHCKNRRAEPVPPEMAALPLARMSAFYRPFSYVGIDFFGPFPVSVGRRSEKRYGVVFTCLTCRAVHIEVAFSLTTASCVIALRNFIARRGVPIEIFSDNGTNLKGAERELREAQRNVNYEELQSRFTTAETKWTFIPPASPHMGGAWERMVRSIKTALYQIITPATKLKDEKLHNLLLEVESIINSRPLTYLSLDTAEQEALTPNHFLLGTSSGDKPPGHFDNKDQFVKSLWRHSQMLANHFWKRWVSEMLPELTRRTKWFQRCQPIQIGDVAIVVDPNLPRHCWPKGIVTSVYPGKDDQVRSATVRTSTGEYHRPATKIAILDVMKKTVGGANLAEVFPTTDRETGGEDVGDSQNNSPENNTSFPTV